MSTEGTPSAAGRSWVYQWRRPLAGAAVALLLYTLAGFFLVPRILRNQLETFARETLNRELRLEDVRFNPFTLTATLSGLRLADRDAADLIRVQRVLANLEVSGIFRRAVRFAQVHIERPSVSARILADGRPSVSDLLESDGQASDGPLELPRLIIDQLLITGGQLSFADASRRPVYEAQFAPLELDVKNLITIPEEGGEHAITIGVGENARLRWTGRQVVEPLRFTGQLDITGLALPPLWDYFGRDERLRLRRGTVDLALPYEVRRGAGVPFELTLREATARVNDLAVRPADEEEDWLTVARSEASGIEAAWPAAQLQIARVAIEGPAILARLEEDGRLNWQHALPASSEAPADDARPWNVTIATFELQEGRASLHAATDAERRMLTFADTRVRATGIRSAAGAPVTFTAGTRVQERGQLDLSGTVTPSPLAFDVAFGAEAIDLAPLAPYLASMTRASLAGGMASFKGTAAMTTPAAPAVGASSGETKPPLRVAAGGALENVALHDASGERLIAWSRMAIDGFTLEDPPNRARIRTVTFDRPYAKLVIDKDGRLNLSTALAPPEGSAAAPDEGAAGPERSASNSAPASPTLEVGTIRLRDGSAEFADLSLLREFRAQIHSAEGTIRDLSSFAAAPATIAIEGRVDKTGFVKVGGTLRTSDPLAASEVTLGFRDIEMPRLTPYVAEFAGYAVQSGALDLDVRYTVKARRLVGTHSIVARDLVLGERVKDSKAPGLAVRLAVALLKDRQGRINLDVPVEGSVDAPEFNYRAVFWSAMRTILGNAAKAPFRALGRLFGRDEEDLELVEFDAGRSDLLPADASTLARLAEQLTARPELTIQVEGRFDPKADPPAIRRARLDALIEARRPAATAAAAPGASALETILEGLFVETFSADALAAERARFIPTVAPAGAEAAPPPVGATPPAATPALTDAAAFYEALRARLLEAQPVRDGDLQALASTRAAAIRDALTKGGAIEAARIKLAAPASVKRSKANSSRIASEMTMTAGDAEES